MMPRSSRPADGPILVVGELDGLHRGHRRLIEAGTSLAARTGRRCDAVVFDVEERVAVLTEPGERSRQVLARGVAACRVLGVPARNIDADDLADLIATECEPAIVVTACPPPSIQDDRYPDLIAALRRDGLEVIEVDRLRDHSGVISSGRVRSALRSGDVGDAAKLIGSPYSISGEVRYGQQLGRTIGFRTANLEPPTRRVLPAHGVYAALVSLPDGRSFEAAVNVGVRPTVESAGRTLVEAHLLDFDGDLYGRKIEVAFVSRIRSEQRFDGLDALRTQLRRDVDSTRALLSR